MGGNATSIEGLKQLIRNDVASAMEEAMAECERDIQSELYKFYGSGQPVDYIRGSSDISLLDAGHTDGVTGTGGDHMEFEGYLDTSGSYIIDPRTTRSGCSGSGPSMEQVIELTDHGVPFPTKRGGQARPSAGTYRNYWEKAMELTEQDVKAIFDSYFG